MLKRFKIIIVIAIIIIAYIAIASAIVLTQDEPIQDDDILYFKPNIPSMWNEETHEYIIDYTLYLKDGKDYKNIIVHIVYCDENDNTITEKNIHGQKSYNGEIKVRTSIELPKKGDNEFLLVSPENVYKYPWDLDA